MIKRCITCSTKFDGRRDAKTCSVKCRKQLQRHRSEIRSKVANPVIASVAEKQTDDLNVKKRARKIAKLLMVTIGILVILGLAFFIAIN